eukprot:7529013-Pyramimonas_sp.AAC.2
MLEPALVGGGVPHPHVALLSTQHVDGGFVHAASGAAGLCRRHLGSEWCAGHVVLSRGVSGGREARSKAHAHTPVLPRRAREMEARWVYCGLWERVLDARAGAPFWLFLGPLEGRSVSWPQSSTPRDPWHRRHRRRCCRDPSGSSTASW